MDAVMSILTLSDAELDYVSGGAPDGGAPDGGKVQTPPAKNPPDKVKGPDVTFKVEAELKKEPTGSTKTIKGTVEIKF